MTEFQLQYTGLCIFVVHADEQAIRTGNNRYEPGIIPA